MKKYRFLRLSVVLLMLTALLAAAVIPAQAAATWDAAEPIDPSRKCSLSMIYKTEEGHLVQDLEIEAYLVASISTTLHYAPTGSFASYPFAIDTIRSQSEWSSLATTIESYIEADHIAPTALQVTNEKGEVKFTGLEQGLYFVRWNGKCGAIRPTGFTSSFVAVPDLDDSGKWVYDRTAVPKPGNYRPSGPTHTPYKVIKEWVDESSSVFRPDHVDIEIYCDGALYQSVMLRAAEDWTYTWTDTGSHSWSVVERDVPLGYFVTIDQVENTFIVTNTFGGMGGPGGDEYFVVKQWDDAADPSHRPDHVDIDIYKDGVLDQTVKLDEACGWTYTWTDTDASSWVVMERNIPADYICTIEKKGFTFYVTNTYVKPEEYSYEVKKVWDDAENPSHRPESVDVALYRDGSLDRVVKLTEAGGWSYKWTTTGKSSWTVMEKSIPEGYVASLESSGNSFTITNTLKSKDPPDNPPDNPPGPHEYHYRVDKIWEDAADPSHRPEFIEADIYRDGELFQTVKLSEDNSWTYSWTSAELYTWSVIEKEVPEDYRVTITQNGNVFTITNIYDPGMEYEYTVMKVWNDGDMTTWRTDHVDINIYRNGELYETVRLDPDVHWSYSWMSPDVYTWSVTEVKIPVNYRCSIRQEGNKFIVTNTLVLPSDQPETGDAANKKLYIELMVLAGIGLVVVGTAKRKPKDA